MNLKRKFISSLSLSLKFIFISSLSLSLKFISSLSLSPSSLQSEIKHTLYQLQFWLNFTVSNPWKLPETLSDVESYGIEEINDLVNFYDANKKDTYKGKSVL